MELEWMGKEESGHTIDCLYEHELAVLGLTDTPDLRVMYWSNANALQWVNDKPKVPDFKPEECGCIVQRSADV